MKNFFNDKNTNLDIPEEVYIVGTGPLGLTHHWRIKDDDFTIVVNEAIKYSINPNIWLVSDSDTYKKQWFKDGLKKDVIKIFSKELVENGNLEDKCDYYFEQRLPFGSTISIEFGCLRPNASVAISALQFAYWAGAERITFCGIDMSDRYKAYLCTADAVIQYILNKDKNIIISSLSQTNLDIELI